MFSILPLRLKKSNIIVRWNYYTLHTFSVWKKFELCEKLFDLWLSYFTVNAALAKSSGKFIDIYYLGDAFAWYNQIGLAC